MDATVAEFYHQAAREEIAVTELAPDTDLRDIFRVSKRRKGLGRRRNSCVSTARQVIDKGGSVDGRATATHQDASRDIEERAGKLDLRATSRGRLNTWRN